MGTLPNGYNTLTEGSTAWIAAINSNTVMSSPLLKGLYSELPVTYKEGRFYYAKDNGCLYYDNGSSWVAIVNVVANAGQDISIIMGDDAGSNKLYFKNSSGTIVGYVDSLGVAHFNQLNASGVIYTGKAAEDIDAGMAVYVTGSDGSNLTIAKCDATDVSKYRFMGITLSTVTTGNLISVLLEGLVTGIDTSAFSAGDGLFLGTGGGFSTTAPATGTVQRVGFVPVSDASDGIFVITKVWSAALSAPLTQNFTIRCGDTGGSTGVNIEDTSSNVVASITSGGMFQSASNRIRVQNSFTPSASASAGTTGDIAWDSSYLYICVATNTWKRAVLSLW